MENDIENAAADDARMVKIAGAARTGKTEAIVQRAARLVAGGTAPEQIWCEVSTDLAADELRHRLDLELDLAGAESHAADRVKVATVSDICREVLDSEGAREATGLVPRVLTGDERKFLLEDMKTTGERNRKLRNILRFFERQWAAGKPEDTWLSGEAEDLMKLLMRKLRHVSAMLPEELAFRCAGYLASDAGEPARHRFAYVLADDYQNLSCVEQEVVRYCAGEQLLVAGNPAQTVNVGTQYPNPEGFSSFDKLRHGVSVHVLETMHGNRAALAASVALSHAGDLDDGSQTAELPAEADDTGHGDESLACVKFATPNDELNEVTKYLRYLIDDHDITSRTYIVVPNRVWLRSAVKVCRQRGFKIDTAGMPAGVGGDPRDLSRSRGMQAYVKLALLADPKSAVAWRCWCGLGHALLNSDAWMRLEDYADENGLDIVSALSRAAEEYAHGAEPFLRVKALATAWESGQALIRDNGKRRGFALLHAVGAEKLPEFANVDKLMDGDETAAELFALTHRELTSPRFTPEEQALRFVTLENLCGLSADNIVVLGCVDGFTPPRDAFEVVSTDEDRDSVMNASRRAFASALAKGESRVIVSFFTKTDLELAERTKMQVTRVRSEEGKRVALLRPSSFIGEMGDAGPGTIGGQQFMAKFGLD